MSVSARNLDWFSALWLVDDRWTMALKQQAYKLMIDPKLDTKPI